MYACWRLLLWFLSSPPLCHLQFLNEEISPSPAAVQRTDLLSTDPAFFLHLYVHLLFNLEAVNELLRLLSMQNVEEKWKRKFCEVEWLGIVYIPRFISAKLFAVGSVVMEDSAVC